MDSILAESIQDISKLSEIENQPARVRITQRVKEMHKNQIKSKRRANRSHFETIKGSRNGLGKHDSLITSTFDRSYIKNRLNKMLGESRRIKFNNSYVNNSSVNKSIEFKKVKPLLNQKKRNSLNISTNSDMYPSSTIIP